MLIERQLVAHAAHFGLHGAQLRFKFLAGRALDDELPVRGIQLALRVAQLRGLLAHGLLLGLGLRRADHDGILRLGLPLGMEIPGDAAQQHADQQPRSHAQQPAGGAGLRCVGGVS
ncbi:hypothetical protein D3C71_1404290 [compost metagenome]